MTKKEIAAKLEELVMSFPDNVKDEWYGTIRSLYAETMEEVAKSLGVKIREYDYELECYKD